MKKIQLFVLFCLLLAASSQVIAQSPVSEVTDNSATDGWQLIPSGVTENLNAVHFANTTHGYIGGSWATCLKSSNGGFNWVSLNVPSASDFLSIWATSPDRAHIGAWDTILNTQNGGVSWNGTHTNTVNFLINDIQFHSIDNGYAFLQASAFIKTTNGGTSWSELTGCGVIDDFLAGQMVDQNTGYAVGKTAIIGKTTDGGVTWTQYDWNAWTEWTPIDIEGVHFTSTTKGIAVADSGVIFRTNDGGASWVRSSIAGPEDRLMDVWFTDASNGWIVGYHGLIFRTYDGGDSWQQEPVLTTNDLNSVYFISTNLGWVVGANGTILRYGGPAGTGEADPLPDVRDIRLYPNPASGQTTLSIEMANAQEADIELFDSQGRSIKTIFRGKLQEGHNEFKLKTHGLAEGIYRCRVALPAGITNRTIIFQ